MLLPLPLPTPHPKGGAARTDGLSPDTPYVISNLTTVAHIGTPVDLEEFFRTVSGRCDDRGAADLIRLSSVKIAVSYGHDRVRFLNAKEEADEDEDDEDEELVVHLKKLGIRVADGGGGDLSEGPNAPRCIRKHFGNQVTLVGHFVGVDGAMAVAGTGTRSTSTGGPRVNIKVFQNGAVQITGARTLAHAHEIPEAVIAILRSVRPSPPVLSPDDLRCTDARVCLINAQFRLGMEVDRRALVRVMRGSFPRTICSFEPCVHAAVKIQLMHNQHPPTASDGVCRCSPESRCRGKGRGAGDGQCRRVTILVFHSGCVTVTGAQTQAQVDAAYAFTLRVSDSDGHSRAGRTQDGGFDLSTPSVS
jgi:hypothetical protein